jgi:Zn finger protein HypA/HybF involved in hydrogenase expression
MGNTTDAHCYSCGYDEIVTLGAGMSNFQTFAEWPVYCKECQAITSANMRSTPIRCGSCGGTNVMAYGNGNLVQGGMRVVEQWQELTLTDGDYFCPSCEAFTLKFGTSAKGDRKIFFD